MSNNGKPTRMFENQSFESFFDDGSNVYENIEFRRCTFFNCDLSITRDPTKRTIARHIRLIKCHADACRLTTPILEDVYVQDLKCAELDCWGAAYKHVTLKGRFGKLRMTYAFPGSMTDAGLGSDAPMNRANVEYYKTVDWALDISQAEFLDADLRGVPAHLIRRDPETQVVVTWAKAQEGAWREVDLSDTHWRLAIENMLMPIPGHQPCDKVLIAPKRSRKFRQLLAGLHRLRLTGVAEPD